MSLIQRFVRASSKPGLFLTNNERLLSSYRSQTFGAIRLQAFSTSKPPIPPKNEPMQTFDIKGREKLTPSIPTTTTTQVTKISPQVKDTRSYPKDVRKGSGGRSAAAASPVLKDKDDDKKFRVNEDITGVDDAMLVGPEGAMGKMSFEEIKQQAAKLQLDMVEVSRTPTSVIKLMNFQAFVEEKKALRKQREELMGTQPKQLEDILPPIKEIQVSTSIEHHDFELKKEFIRKFLVKGHPVKLMLRMKKSNSVSKEARPQKAQELIERITSDLADVLALDKIKNDPKPVMGSVVKFFYPKDHIIKAVTGEDVPANLASSAKAAATSAKQTPKAVAAVPSANGSTTTTSTPGPVGETTSSNYKPLVNTLQTSTPITSNGGRSSTRADGGSISASSTTKSSFGAPKPTSIPPQTSTTTSNSNVNKRNSNINRSSPVASSSPRKPNVPQPR